MKKTSNGTTNLHMDEGQVNDPILFRSYNFPIASKLGEVRFECTVMASDHGFILFEVAQGRPLSLDLLYPERSGATGTVAHY